MIVTKQHYLLLGGLLATCLLVTLFVMWDKEQDKKIDTHVTDATKELTKQEKEQRKVLDKNIGVAVPSKEEVARLLALTDDTNEYEKLLANEYGKKYSEEIYSAYVIDKLPSNKDTALQARVKEALLYARFNDDGYATPVSVLDGDFIATPPFASTEQGFQPITSNLLAGYITFSRISLSKVESETPEYRINMVVYADKTMTVEEFEQQLGKAKFTMEDIKLRPFNAHVRETLGDTLGETTMFTKGDAVKVNFLDVASTDWSKQSPKETIIYKGLPVMASYYWSAPNATWETLTTASKIAVGTKAFDIYKLDDMMYLPYTD